MSRPSMRVFLAVTTAYLAVPAEAAPTCKQRVEALKALAARLEPEMGGWDKGPLEVGLNNYDSPRGSAERKGAWKKRGVRLTAPLAHEIDAEVEPALARDLVELTAAAKVELCVPQNAPVEQHLSRDADQSVLAPLLAKLAGTQAEDRATLVAARIEQERWKCQHIPDSFKAVQYVAPSDRLAIVSKSVAESLEVCGCPAAEAERIYALLMLMADVWSDKEVCAPVVVGNAPAAKPLKLAGPVMDLVKALNAAGPAGVALPQALPPKPVKPVKKP